VIINLRYKEINLHNKRFVVMNCSNGISTAVYNSVEVQIQTKPPRRLRDDLHVFEYLRVGQYLENTIPKTTCGSPQANDPFASRIYG
jgi:hypothetical protein